jgi:hypothetical protein
MNKAFFGQNVFRISSTTYNIDVTVTYPWSLSGQNVAFLLKSGATQVASTTHKMKIDIEETINDLFSNVTLSAGSYILSISKSGYSGSVRFALGTPTNISVTLNITETSYHNPIGINVRMDSAADPDTSEVRIHSTDAKGDDADLTLSWGYSGSDKEYQ